LQRQCALSIPCQNVQIPCQINVFIFKILHDRFEFPWASKRYTSTCSLPQPSSNKLHTKQASNPTPALRPCPSHQQQQFLKFDPYTKMFYKNLPIRMSTKVHNKRNVYQYCIAPARCSRTPWRDGEIQQQASQIRRIDSKGRHRPKKCTEDNHKNYPQASGTTWLWQDQGLIQSGFFVMP
jgi:hypothetical protein